MSERRVQDSALSAGLRYGAQLASAGLVIALVVIFVVLAKGSKMSINVFGLGFVAGTEWDPMHGQFGALPFLFGTVLSSALALLLAVPGAFLVAAYVAELGPRRLRGPVGALLETLAAVLSVVYGMWGVFVLAPGRWRRGRS